MDNDIHDVQRNGGFDETSAVRDMGLTHIVYKVTSHKEYSSVDADDDDRLAN